MISLFHDSTHPFHNAPQAAPYSSIKLQPHRFRCAVIAPQDLMMWIQADENRSEHQHHSKERKNHNLTNPRLLTMGIQFRRPKSDAAIRPRALSKCSLHIRRCIREDYTAVVPGRFLVF